MAETNGRKIILNIDSEPDSEKKQENKKEIKKDRFYLPILNLNKKEIWPSIPVEKRQYFTSEVAEKTCLEKCCGHDGLKSACCTLDPEDLEHVLGPVDEESIKKILAHFKQMHYSIVRSDVVIEYEEGVAIGNRLFNGHPAFMSEKSYPMLRFQVNGPRFTCKFLNMTSGKCSIYKIRPEMCENYLCEYIKTNFLVRKPNTTNYRKIR